MFDMNKFRFSGKTNRGEYYGNDLVDLHSNATFAIWNALESLDSGYCGKDGFIKSIREILQEMEQINSAIWDAKDKFSNQ